MNLFTWCVVIPSEDKPQSRARGLANERDHTHNKHRVVCQFLRREPLVYNGQGTYTSRPKRRDGTNGDETVVSATTTGAKECGQI